MCFDAPTFDKSHVTSHTITRTEQTLLALRLIKSYDYCKKYGPWELGISWEGILSIKRPNFKCQVGKLQKK